MTTIVAHPGGGRRMINKISIVRGEQKISHAKGSIVIRSGASRKGGGEGEGYIVLFLCLLSRLPSRMYHMKFLP